MFKLKILILFCFWTFFVQSQDSIKVPITGTVSGTAVIPVIKGDKGDVGPVGPTGPQGTPGAPGKDGITTTVYISGIAKQRGTTYDCYTASDIDSAMALVKAGKVTCIQLMNDGITKNIIIPKSFTTLSNNLIIAGNGNTLKGCVRSEYINSWKESQDNLSRRVLIRDITFRSSSTDTCVYLSCYYNPTVTDCKFLSGKVGVYLSYCMNYVVSHCDFVNLSSMSVVSDYLRGVTDSTKNFPADAGSNNGAVQYCRFFLSPSAFAGFAIYASSKNNSLYNTFEGSTHDTLTGCEWGIYYDYRGVTVSKLFTDISTHNEYKFKRGYTYLRQPSDGIYIQSQLWQQHGGTLVDATDAIGGKVLISDIPNWAGITFKTAAAVQWKFTDNKAFGLDATNNVDPTRVWVGTQPTMYYFDFTNSGSWKVNRKP